MEVGQYYIIRQILERSYTKQIITIEVYYRYTCEKSQWNATLGSHNSKQDCSKHSLDKIPQIAASPWQQRWI